jgi:hypothetical protein
VFLIDKRSAAEWVEALHWANKQFVHSLSPSRRIEVADFAAQLAFAMLRTFQEVAQDDREATHSVENAAHGMSHAIVQTLVHLPPPSFDRPENTVN